MGKTRIHDLAAEFGIESGQLIKLLAEMDIHVRSHLSGMDEGQVARVRTRWEREKRRKSEPASKARTRRRKKAAEEPKQEAEAVARPRRRRRTAAEVAFREAEEEERLAAEAAEEAAAAPEEEAAVLEEVSLEEVSLEERAAQLFKEPVESEDAAPAVAETPPDVELEAEPEPVAGAKATLEEPVKPLRVERAAPPPPRRRPRVPSGPRPVASAAPGEIAEERRRDKKRRRKSKRSQVDKEAVQANISRTMASIKGPAPRKSSRRRDDEPSARDVAEQRKAEEREREKTLVRVTEFITVTELASTLGVSATAVVTFCFKGLGMMVTVNQRLDFDQIELIAESFGYIRGVLAKPLL